MGMINLANTLTKMNDTFKTLGYVIDEQNDLEIDNTCDIATLWGRIGKPSSLANDEEDKHLEFVTDGKDCFLRLTIMHNDGYDERFEIFQCSFKDIKRIAEIFVYMMKENNLQPTE